MALGVAAVLLLLVPPTALAAPPANDDLADAQTLSSDLPVHVTGTTLEATEEVGEPAPAASAFAATGLSVWFEWEATSTGFVTVSSCGSQTGNVLGVYTGNALDALTEVAGDFSSLGPDCTTFRGTAVTFKAISGTTYDIQVEGRASFPEEANFGQGPFELSLEATPLPANDNFEDAAILSGQIHENGVYAAGASGFSWNATKESGEPLHAGDPGGASVWYSWTAPFSGGFGLGSCGRFEILLSVYTGDSVDALTRVADQRGCGILRFPASVGTTYRIAVDGVFDSASAAAAMGSFSVNVFREPPSSGPFSDGRRTAEREVDVVPPDTRISKTVFKRTPPIWVFRFSSTEPGSRFECKLDARPFKRCRPSKIFKHPKPGRHTLKARAIDSNGNVDPSPAVAHFTAPDRIRKLPKSRD